jgi:hypothetical protein
MVKAAAVRPHSRAHQHVTQAGRRQAAVQFEIVHTGYAEHGVDIIGGQ